MATRSYIGIKKANGTIEGVYCHSDGYLKWNGRLLLNHYNSEVQAEAIVGLGDLSSIGKNFIGEEQSITAYHRDRGEPWESTQPCEFKDEKDFTHSASTNGGAQFAYLFRDGAWWWSDCHSDFKLLEQSDVN